MDFDCEPEEMIASPEASPIANDQPENKPRRQVVESASLDRLIKLQQTTELTIEEKLRK
jgi:hypothetical protein